MRAHPRRAAVHPPPTHHTPSPHPCSVKKYPVVIPRYEWTLEWVLSSPPPLHQFEQTPVVVEVTDRHPNADQLVYKGANVVAGYPHPDTGKIVDRAEHLKLAAPVEHTHPE